jgi:hypothetical protein
LKTSHKLFVVLGPGGLASRATHDKNTITQDPTTNG